MNPNPRSATPPTSNPTQARAELRHKLNQQLSNSNLSNNSSNLRNSSTNLNSLSNNRSGLRGTRGGRSRPNSSKGTEVSSSSRWAADKATRCRLPI